MRWSMKSRVISILVALLVAVAMAPVTAGAAYADEDTVGLTVRIGQSEGSGTLMINGVDQGTSFEGTYSKNTEVEIAVIPDSGYDLVNWAQGDRISTSNPWTLTMTEETEVVAWLDEQPLNLGTVELDLSQGSATVSGSQWEAVFYALHDLAEEGVITTRSYQDYDLDKDGNTDLYLTNMSGTDDQGNPVCTTIFEKAANSNLDSTYELTVGETLREGAKSENRAYCYRMIWNFADGGTVVPDKSDQVITASNVTKTYGNAAFSLGAKTNGDGALSYTSGNTKVAAVSSAGKVTIKGAGTAKITIKAAETANCNAAAKTVTVTVKKAANPLKVKKKTKKVKYSKLKKAKQTLKRSAVVGLTKAGQGTTTYTISAVKKGTKSFKGKITIARKTGKVTVKKGLKKGTYKVTIKVKAAGNTNYKTVTKTVTSKIVVK